MGSVASSSESDCWESEVLFYENDHSESFKHNQLGNHLIDALGHDEYIKQIKVYKTDSNLSGTNTKLFKHLFIVFQTNTWWYSLEKNNSRITLQRGNKEETVKDKQTTTARSRCFQKQNSPTVGENSISVHGLIYELHNRIVLKKGYNLWERNCIHFVADVLRWLPEISSTNERASISLEKWHKDLKKYLKNKSYNYDDPRRIFFAGKTCFPLSVEADQVLEPTGASIVYQNHMISVLTIFNASGDYLPPTIVLPEGDFEIDHSVFKDASYDSTPDGWASVHSEIFENVYKTLHSFAVKQVDTPIVLFVEGHSTYINEKSVKFCDKNGIYIYDLFQNTTHFFQDPMTVAWREAAQQWKNTNNRQTIPIINFPTVFSEAWKQFATLDNFKKGFIEYKLLPFPVSLNKSRTRDTTV